MVPGGVGSWTGEVRQQVNCNGAARLAPVWGGWCQVTEGLGLAEALWPQGLAQSSRLSSGVGVGSV